MNRTALRGGIVAAVLCIGIAVGFGISRLNQQRTASSGLPSAAATPSDCALSGQSFLATPFDGLELMVDNDLGAPIGGRHQAGPASTFSGGHIHGSIATVAVTGPDRASEDAYARSLGYQVGKWPLVPLTGSVVAHNPGLLEVYEKHYVFSAVSDATAAEKYFADSWAADPQAHALDSTTLGSPWTVGTETTLGPADGQHEESVQMVAQIGPRVVVLAFQGGHSLDAASIIPTAHTAITRLRAACPN